MNKIMFGMAALTLSSVLMACPGGVSTSPTITGTITGFPAGTVATVKVYAMTNPRVDWFDSSAFFTPPAVGATVIAEGTVSTAGVFSVQLPSDTTMTLYSQTRVASSQQNGCTVSSSGLTTAKVAQVVIKVESNGASLGFLTQQSPGADNINANVPGTYYDIWHYWVNTGFSIQKTCSSFEGNLGFAAGWNSVSARTTVSGGNINLFDRLNTTLPSGLEWVLKTGTVNGFSSN